MSTYSSQCLITISCLGVFTKLINCGLHLYSMSSYLYQGLSIKPQMSAYPVLTELTTVYVYFLNPLLIWRRGILFFPCVSVCLCVRYKFSSKILQMLENLTHSFFSCVIWWDYVLYNLDINFLLNEDFVYY